MVGDIMSAMAPKGRFTHDVRNCREADGRLRELMDREGERIGEIFADVTCE